MQNMSETLDELDNRLDLLGVRFRSFVLDLFASNIQPFATFVNGDVLRRVCSQPPVVGYTRDNICDREGDSPVDVKEDGVDFSRNSFVCGEDFECVAFCPIGSQLPGIPYQDEFLHGWEHIIYLQIWEKHTVQEVPGTEILDRRRSTTTTERGRCESTVEEELTWRVRLRGTSGCLTRRVDVWRGRYS